jgi:hypothetical protein
MILNFTYRTKSTYWSDDNLYLLEYQSSHGCWRFYKVQLRNLQLRLCSAGFGMLSGHFWDILDLVEYRGSVFSIGGDDG